MFIKEIIDGGITKEELEVERRRRIKEGLKKTFLEINNSNPMPRQKIYDYFNRVDISSEYIDSILEQLIEENHIQEDCNGNLSIRRLY